MYEKMTVRISHTEERTELLGPYSRFVIWVHGCCFDCEGCLAVNTRLGSYEDINVETLSDMIIKSGCEGVTISGGEPFLQAESLSEVIRIAREKRGIGVIIYSGFTLEEIRRNKEFDCLTDEADILIDGRYIKELDDGRAYVGSSNQKIHYLTDRYRAAGEKYYAQKKRRAEIKLTRDRIVLIGVPSANVLNAWKAIREKNGGIGNDF